MKIILILLISSLTIAVCNSCYYNKQDILYPDGNIPCDAAGAVKFSSDVLPVMNASCNSSGCHNTSSAAAGVILDTYAGIKNQATNGRLMGSINQTSGYSSMPKGGAKLNSCTLTKIQQWINDGTPNN